MMRLRRLLLDGAKLVLFYFELLVTVIAGLAIGTGFMSAAMPATWVSASLSYK